MAIACSRPDFFSSLAFTFTPADPDTGRFTGMAPCGCTIRGRRVLVGPLAGLPYGDARYEICPSHISVCDDCGQQRWPHNDCRCEH